MSALLELMSVDVTQLVWTMMEDTIALVTLDIHSVVCS